AWFRECGVRVTHLGLVGGPTQARSASEGTTYASLALRACVPGCYPPLNQASTLAPSQRRRFRPWPTGHFDWHSRGTFCERACGQVVGSPGGSGPVADSLRRRRHL